MQGKQPVNFPTAPYDYVKAFSPQAFSTFANRRRAKARSRLKSTRCTSSRSDLFTVAVSGRLLSRSALHTTDVPGELHYSLTSVAESLIVFDPDMPRFTGVYLQEGKFMSCICYKGRNVTMGQYKDEQHAARVYDRARLHQASKQHCSVDVLFVKDGIKRDHTVVLCCNRGLPQHCNCELTPGFLQNLPAVNFPAAEYSQDSIHEHATFEDFVAAARRRARELSNTEPASESVTHPVGFCAGS